MLATPDLNNNTILETQDDQSTGLPGLPEETEMRLSLRNNCLHLYNPQFGTWIPVDNLDLDKKVYLYHALASNITNQLKDVGNSVRRQLKLSEFGTVTGFKFLAGIQMDSKDLGTGDEKKIYASAIHAVSEELFKFSDLHDELDKYYGKLRTSWEPGADGVDSHTLPEPEKVNENLSEDLEERLFINVPWDWDSSFLTSKEFPAFSNMASKAKIMNINKRLGNGNTSLVKVFKKSQDRPPMEPTWLKSLERPTSEIYDADKDLKTRDQGIPCVILRKLGLFYGNNGEQSHNFELITGKEFRGNYKLMDHLLPATFPDILDRAQIVYPIAFRYVALPGPKCGDLCDEVDQPRPLDLGVLLRTMQGLSTGSWNSINKAEEAILRTVQSLDTRNDQFVFQRSIQNVHMYGDYESTAKLKLMMERINDQSDALRLLASTGSESVGHLLKLFQTITSRLLLIKAEKDTDQEKVNTKDMVVGKAEIPGDDILRTDFEDWFRSASTIPMLTEMSATAAGVSGILHKLQDAYQQVGSALLNVVSNPVDGVKLNFEECVEAICALLILAESVMEASMCEDWFVKDLLNTVEETKNALLSLKGTINRISACAEVLQSTSDSAVFTLQEITVMRKKQYEKIKKKEEGGFWRFGFLKDKKTGN